MPKARRRRQARKTREKEYKKKQKGTSVFSRL
jgi:hypothetical protein